MPTAAILYNYDIDRDTFPGLLIAKGGSGPDENDPTKYQAWRIPVSDAPLVIEGDVVVRLWTATKDFDPTKRGAMSVYLLDFDGSNHVVLGGATFTDTTWQDGDPSWVLKTFVFSISSYTLAPGHDLELKVIVEGSSDDGMWLAYDTGDYDSQVDVPS